MAWYPIGARTKKDARTVSSFVPLPPLLILSFVVNALILFVCCILVVFMAPGDSTFTAVEQALVVVFGVLLSASVLWALATNRPISRYLIGINAIGIASLVVVVFGSRVVGFTAATFFSVVSCLAVLYILVGDVQTSRYYSVLSGALDVSDYQPYESGFTTKVSSFGDWVTLIAELALAVLALAIFGGWFFGWFDYLN